MPERKVIGVSSNHLVMFLPRASGARLPNLSELGASFVEWGKKSHLKDFRIE